MLRAGGAIATVCAVEQVRVGDSDLTVSRVGLGCNNFGWRLDGDATRAVVEAALDAGVTHWDTADIYGGQGGSERLLGELLKGRREQVVLATKFGKPMGDGEERRGSRAYVRKAIDGSLERLRTDYVDLYYLHEPDPATPIAETLSALAELVEEGKIRYAGCSNFAAAQLREANAAGAPIRFAAVQNHFNLLERGDETDALPAARELGIGYVPYFPLASGLLSGKYRRGAPAPVGTRLDGREIDDATYDRVEALAAFAESRGRALLELAVSALASQPGIPTVIAGATTPEQVRANAAAAEWQLGADELAELATLG